MRGQASSRGAWISIACAFASAALLRGVGALEGASPLLAFLALVPHRIALECCRSWKGALFAAWVMSIASVVALFPWFPTTARGYSGASLTLLWALTLTVAPLLEPQFIVAALAERLGRPSFSRGALLWAVAYVETELTIPKLFFDTIGIGLFPSRWLRQGADLGGIHVLTLFIVVFAAGSARFLVNAASRRGARKAWGWLAISLGSVVFLAGYGALRLTSVEQAVLHAREHPIGIVQANITHYEKLRAERGAFEAVEEVLRSHEELTRGLGSPELVIWPETVYPTTFGSPKSEEGAQFDERIGGFVAESGVALLFGAYDAEGEREYNAAFLLSPGGGRIVGRYRKTMLFPLTEWVPTALDSEWLRSVMPWAGRWTKGEGAAVLDLQLGGDSVPIAPLICYDAIVPDLAREAAGAGARLFVVLSNDSWFPDDRAPRLHLASAAFRSVENRVPLVRATNSGISAFVSPTGDLREGLGWNVRGAIIGRVAIPADGISPALRGGAWQPLVLLAWGMGLALRTRQAKMRKATKAGITTK